MSVGLLAGNHLVPCVAELVRSCVRFMHVEVFLIQSASFIHLVCHCASLSTTFALSQSVTWFSSTAWSVMACELHYSHLPWRLGSVYQLWHSPLLSCVPSSDQTSCLYPWCVSWSSSCKAHDRSIRSTPYHTWDQVISRSRAPSSCKQSRRDQDVRRTSKRCH